MDGEAFCETAHEAGVPASVIGRTGGESLDLPGARPISLDKLRRAHEDWLPSYMERIA